MKLTRQKVSILQLIFFLSMPFATPLHGQTIETSGLAQAVEELKARVEIIENNSIKVQSGTFTIRADGTRALTDSSFCADHPDNIRGIRDGRIDFPSAFADAPAVVAAINAFDIVAGEPNDTHRLRVVVTSVDRTGFNYQFYTWCRTVVYNANAVWIAHGRGQ